MSIKSSSAEQIAYIFYLEDMWTFSVKYLKKLGLVDGMSIHMSSTQISVKSYAGFWEDLPGLDECFNCFLNA